MAVTKCNRNGCNNILCARYSSTYGYICDECFKELNNMPVPIDVLKFMEAKKIEPENAQNIRGWLNSIFTLL